MNVTLVLNHYLFADQDHDKHHMSHFTDKY